MYQTVRVYVWHEWQRLPTGWYWTLRLLCTFIDDADGSLGAGSGAASSPLRVLGNLLQSVVVQLDPVLYPDPSDGCIEWRKADSAAVTDGFELHRKEWTAAGKACGVKLFLVPDYSPPLFTLSSTLARIVGLRQASHPYVLRAVWRYCTEHSLLSATDASVIAPDDALSALMDSHQACTLQQINHRITQQPHMTPAEPIQLQHSIARPAAGAQQQPADSVSVFDITLPLPEMPAIAAAGTAMQTTFAAFAAAAASDASSAAANTAHTAAQDDTGHTAAAAATAAAVSNTTTSSGALLASSSPSAASSASSSSPAPSAPVASTASSAPLSLSASSVPPSLSKEWRDLSALGDAISSQLSELHRIATRRHFLHAFAACPVDTIHLLLAQQARHAMLSLTTHRAEQAEQAVRREQAHMAAAALELSSTAGAAGNATAAAASSGAHLHLAGSRSVALLGGEEEKARRGRYYAAEWMQDAVDRYLEHASSGRQQMVDA